MTTADVALQIFQTCLRSNDHVTFAESLELLEASWDLAEAHKKKEAQHLQLRAK